MMKIPNRTWAEINLDALAHNMRVTRRLTVPTAKVLAVVKADGYGHGAVHAAKTVLENGADYLAVACVDEATELRHAGIVAPILILGYTAPDNMDAVVKYDITQTVYDTDYAVKLSEIAACCGKTAKIHIKLDTGMNRIGFPADSTETISNIKAINNLKNIEIEGLFTHFAKADESDDSYTRMQFEKFCSCTDALEKEGVSIPLKHVCNSAGIIKFPDMHLDMVRAGIMIYGLEPSSEVDIKNLDLRPVMCIKTKIIRIQYIRKGQKISYGGTFTAPADMKIATLAIGYADGYPRLLSNKSKVIAGRKYADIVGRICMDQCMADVTGVNNIDVGDVAVVMGCDADKEVSCKFLADTVGTIGYEIVCMVSRRIPRVYVENGKITDTVSYMV